MYPVDVVGEWSNTSRIVILKQYIAGARSLGQHIWRKFHAVLPEQLSPYFLSYVLLFLSSSSACN
jgi:hypothetical protein